MTTHGLFPRLSKENHRSTSPSSPNYNCIAWAAEDTDRWWQPGIYWPLPSPKDDCGIGALEQVFRSLGYYDCDIGDSELGYEKIALYGNNLFYTHAARQLPSGKWTSKLGKAEDIEHDTAEDVADGVYGQLVGYMKRPQSRKS
jgi:hypothetical protein